LLRTLLFGPLQGYGIAKAIRNISAGALEIEFGSLYSALERLEMKHRSAIGEPRIIG
jgi:DNA-binding PadR family transcriptional regulator